MTKKKIKNRSDLKLDFGCGPNKHTGYFGIDSVKYSDVDLVWDLEKTPYPLLSECSGTAIASHIVEHIEPHGGIFLKVMDEWWRLLKFNGKLEIITPYAGSKNYYMDPTHCNPCNELTWIYFDPHDLNSNGFFWRIYKPKPWKIVELSWNVKGNIKVILQKRKIIPP